MSTLLRLTYQGAIAARNALLPLSDPVTFLNILTLTLSRILTLTYP